MIWNTTNIAWTRARDQAAREAARQEEEAISIWASRGFSLPGGALTAVTHRAQQATLDAAVEVAALQAEKTQQMFFDVARATADAWLRNMEAHTNAELTAFRAYLEGRMRYAELESEANRALAKQSFDHLGPRSTFPSSAGSSPRSTARTPSRA